MLEVRNLNRGRFIKDVNFVVRKGEILGFAGLMGAGRTEVARAVFGADKVDSGEILDPRRKGSDPHPGRCGRARHRLPFGGPQALRAGHRHGCGVQHRAGEHAALLVAGVHSQAPRIRDTAASFVKRLGIKTPSIAQKVALLSGGNQQKIVIAKWLVRDCEILFFDEPTRGIDVGAKSEIYKLLNALAEQGRAIVMISSELPEVLRLSHRILVMCEGRITGELPAAGATQEQIMQLATQRESMVSETA